MRAWLKCPECGGAFAYAVGLQEKIADGDDVNYSIFRNEDGTPHESNRCQSCGVASYPELNASQFIYDDDAPDIVPRAS